MDVWNVTFYSLLGVSLLSPTTRIAVLHSLSTPFWEFPITALNSCATLSLSFYSLLGVSGSCAI